MSRKILFLCILLCLLAAAAGPDVVSAGVDPLASPTPRPTERITAPVISGVNPDAVLSEGNLTDSLPSGSFVPAGISIPVMMDSPPHVEIESQFNTWDNPVLDRSLNLDEIDCGPASLAQALGILNSGVDPLPPSATQLREFMAARGLLYDWGTGVEELVFTAREFGFEGSIPFHDWSFDQLAAYLREEKPLVVSLGINGADNPGHFVTLTGISEDGKWISILDPDSGEKILSREEFLSLWHLQGSAGMIPQKEISTAASDPMLPWMGLFGAISALALTLNLSEGTRASRAFSTLRKQLADPRRKGIGAGPLPPKGPEVIRVPRYETKTIYRGIKSVDVEVPVYETRNIKVGIRGIKKEVPQYETRRVQVGTEQVTNRVPVYSTRKVQIGTRLEKKKIPVTRYITKKVMVWKKFTKRVPVQRTIGSKKIVVGYKNEIRWKKIPVIKKIPYQSAKTLSIKVPVYKSVKYISRYKNVTKTVPKYEQKKVLVGHKTIKETIPVYEERQVQVGTKTVTREMPVYETVKIPIVEEANPSENNFEGVGEGFSPPTGLSTEIWNSLSVANQQMLRQEGIDRADEMTRIEAAKENWIYKTYSQIQEIKEKVLHILLDLGLPVSSEEPNNLVSLSAYKDHNVDLVSENGLVIDSYTPPNILNLLYMEQNLSVRPKVVVTAFPGGAINVNLSSQSCKIRFGDIAVFGTKGGEIGLSHRYDSPTAKFDYLQTKQSFKFSIEGVTYKLQQEGVKNLSNNPNDQVDIKEVSTLKCQYKKIKSLGIAIILGVIVLSGGLIYLISSTGVLVLIPSN